MKCSSLNHFYAMNSVSHLCLDKVTFINVSNNALKTEVLWEMSPNCQGSLTQQHIISQETSKSSATRLWYPQTLYTSFASHYMYFSLSNIKNYQKKIYKIILIKFHTSQACQTNLIQLSMCWLGGRLQRWKTYVHGVSQYTDCKTLRYTKTWKMQAKKRQAYIQNISKLNFTLHTAPNFS
jgi:hypothetical protein